MRSRRVAVPFFLAASFVCLICIALIPTSCISLFQNVIAKSRGESGDRTPPPHAGKPYNLPDLEELRTESHPEPDSQTHDQQLQLDIPREGWERIFFREIDKRTKAAKLSSLRSVLPNDDLEARFWVEYGELGMDGIIIRRKSGAWSGTYIHGSSRKQDFKQYDEELKQPRSGWHVAWNRLLEAGLLTLPDASQIKCLLGGKDTLGFVLETNVNRKYRTYMYEQPDLAECTEARQMVRLIGILSHEFGLQWSTPVP